MNESIDPGTRQSNHVLFCNFSSKNDLIPYVARRLRGTTCFGSALQPYWAERSIPVLALTVTLRSTRGEGALSEYAEMLIFQIVMGLTKKIATGVLALSFVTFVALFGRLPAFRYESFRGPDISQLRMIQKDSHRLASSTIMDTHTLYFCQHRQKSDRGASDNLFQRYSLLFDE